MVQCFTDEMVLENDNANKMQDKLGSDGNTGCFTNDATKNIDNMVKSIR